MKIILKKLNVRFISIELYRPLFIFLRRMESPTETNMVKKLFIPVIALLYTTVYSQNGGNSIYEFLDLTVSARTAAFGGQQISIYDNDLNFVYQNPSLLNGSMSNQLALNYTPYIADIKYGYFSYARTMHGIGNFAAGIHYVDYGEFTEADEYGNKTGHFSANDYSVNLFYSKPILDSLLNIGFTYKFISSRLETYYSWGMAVDAGINYHSSDKLFNSTIVFKNLGVQIRTYSSDGNRESLPFEIQAGISQKLRYAPFRLSLVAQNLETPNLRYTSSLDSINNTDPTTGELKSNGKLVDFGDNVMRHIIIGLEFIPSKYISASFGYNYKRRQELKLVDKTGFVGFSWGLGLNLPKFRISYGHSTYHIGAATNTFSLNLNLSEFKKKF